MRRATVGRRREGAGRGASGPHARRRVACSRDKSIGLDRMWCAVAHGVKRANNMVTDRRITDATPHRVTKEKRPVRDSGSEGSSFACPRLPGVRILCVCAIASTYGWCRRRRVPATRPTMPQNPTPLASPQGYGNGVPLRNLMPFLTVGSSNLNHGMFSVVSDSSTGGTCP